MKKRILQSSILQLFLFIVVGLIPASANASLVTFLWEETGDDVRVTLSGAFDVTGWTALSSNTSESGMNFRNYLMEDEFEDYPPEIYQALQINNRTTEGLVGTSGVLHLSPWKTPSDITYTLAPKISGSFGGQISIRNSEYSQPSAFIGQEGVVDGMYTVDAVYLFSDTTLTALFGDGLDDWANGAHIASFGSNEVWFTATTIIPEPHLSVLLLGAGVAIWGLSRRRRRSL